MLAGNANPWHNVANPLDVNNDTTVGPVDALAIVNGLNWYGSGRLGESLASLVHSGAGEGGIASTAAASSATRTPQAMVDVNDDNLLTPMDALQVINELNEGEGPDLVRATVRMTTNVPVRADEIAVLDYVPASPPPGYQSRQDVDTVTLKTTDTANPTILLNVLVQDIRTDDGVFRDKNGDTIDDSDDFGVFSAYFDVTYDATAYTIPSGNANNSVNDPTKNDPTFPISYVNPKYRQVFGTGSNRVETEYENYPNGPSWEGWSTPGLINEAGGFTGYPSSVYGRELPAVPAAKKEVFTGSACVRRAVDGAIVPRRERCVRRRRGPIYHAQRHGERYEDRQPDRRLVRLWDQRGRRYGARSPRVRQHGSIGSESGSGESAAEFDRPGRPGRFRQRFGQDHQ